MKIELRVDEVDLPRADLALRGIAGTLPCDATVTRLQARQILRLALQPRVLWWLVRSSRH